MAIGDVSLACQTDVDFWSETVLCCVRVYYTFTNPLSAAMIRVWRGEVEPSGRGCVLQVGGGGVECEGWNGGSASGYRRRWTATAALWSWDKLLTGNNDRQAVGITEVAGSTDRLPTNERTKPSSGRSVYGRATTGRPRHCSGRGPVCSVCLSSNVDQAPAYDCYDQSIIEKDS